MKVYLLAAFIIATPAFADPYAGFGMGISSADEHCQDNLTENCSDAPLSLKMHIGYRVIPFVAIEAGYNLYARESYMDETSRKATYELEGFTGSLLGIIPLGIVDIYGKLGVVRWEAAGYYNGRTVSDEYGYSPLAGVGIGLNLTDTFALRLDAEGFYLDDNEDVLVGTIAFGFTAGF